MVVPTGTRENHSPQNRSVRHNCFLQTNCFRRYDRRGVPQSFALGSVDDLQRGDRVLEGAPMFPQHKLFSVGLFVLFTSTHLGCAGQDVRNLFSRNDTAGYKTLEELEAQEHALAKAEGRSEEDKKPSVTARLASWSPFGKSESTDEKSDAVSKASDSRQAEESSRSQRFLVCRCVDEKPLSLIRFLVQTLGWPTARNHLQLGTKPNRNRAQSIINLERRRMRLPLRLAKSPPRKEKPWLTRRR